MRLLVVTNHAGRVIAAMDASTTQHPQMEFGFATMGGQRLHEVDLPQQLMNLPHHERLRAALDHHVPAGKAHLEPYTAD